MWTPKLVTFKEEARATSGIYIELYTVFIDNLYTIL